jgi:hypothetical protein
VEKIKKKKGENIARKIDRMLKGQFVTKETHLLSRELQYVLLQSYCFYTGNSYSIYRDIARDNKKKLEHVMLKVVFFISSYFSKYILLENIEKYYHLFIFKKLFLTLTHQNNPKYIYKKS